MTDLLQIELQSVTVVCTVKCCGRCEGKSMRNVPDNKTLPEYQSAFLHWVHISSARQLFSNSALKQLNIGRLLNPSLQLSEFAQPPAELRAYGTDYHRRRYMSILFMTVFITNICWFLLYSHFILKVYQWQNDNHAVKRQMQAATVALLAKTLRHFTVYFVMATIVYSTLKQADTYFLVAK